MDLFAGGAALALQKARRGIQPQRAGQRREIGPNVSTSDIPHAFQVRNSIHAFAPGEQEKENRRT